MVLSQIMTDSANASTSVTDSFHSTSQDVCCDNQADDFDGPSSVISRCHHCRTSSSDSAASDELNYGMLEHERAAGVGDENPSPARAIPSIIKEDNENTYFTDASFSMKAETPVFPDSFEKWYNHHAEAVLENEKVKLLWDFNVQTDKVIETRRLDLILINKETKQCQVIDIAIPGDTRVVQKEYKMRRLGPEKDSNSHTGPQTLYSLIQDSTSEQYNPETPLSVPTRERSESMESTNSLLNHSTSTEGEDLPLISQTTNNKKCYLKIIAVVVALLVCLSIAIPVAVINSTPSKFYVSTTTLVTTPITSMIVTTDSTVSTTAGPSHLTTTPPSIEACKNPVKYNELWRLDDSGSNIRPNTSHSKNGYACDLYGGGFWFKFSGEGGDLMRNYTAPTRSCGTYIPFWTLYPLPSAIGKPEEIEVYGAYNHPKSVIEKALVMRCSWDTNYDVIYKYTGNAFDPCLYAFCGMKAPK
ncbi:uncharacterized protein [Watersipora subatra]|uniref:uncharacterized protein n=1 Tax=Watersipora subatra TaxID=2589382 RepID=UPI00355C118C